MRNYRDSGDPDGIADFGEFSDRLTGETWQPSVDIFETESALVVRFEMAGVRSEDLKVNVDGEMLRIRGIRSTSSSEPVQRLHQMEIAFGPFETALRLGVPFDRDGVSARLEDGLLEVRLPRRTAVRVEVETS